MNNDHSNKLISITGAKSGRQWRSLDELADTLEFRESLGQEFRENTDLFPETGRRRFLQIMAASLALGGATSCRQPVETILPYAHPPEYVLPGKPLLFATATLQNGLAQGVLVESHMGRPTKVQGNPLHPASLGATDVPSQAAVLTLYDPGRSPVVLGPHGYASWGEFEIALRRAMEQQRLRRGAGLRILTETVTSPTLGAQIRELLDQYPDARWHQYEPTGGHSVRSGTEMLFGRPLNPVYAFDKARIVLSLDSDFLTCGPASTRYARDFADMRLARGGITGMNRMYAIESTYTATGGKAEHRWPFKASEVEAAAEQIASALGVPGAEAPSILRPELLRPMVRDLQANRGATIVIPGNVQSPRLHALAHAMNSAVGAVGTSVFYTEPIEVESVDQVSSLRQLVTEMNAGAVQLLVIVGGNPVFNAPADLAFARALKHVPGRVHMGLYADETAALCDWHVPQTHSLETWSDARAFEGTATILQPLIAPLFGGRSDHELLSVMLGRTARPYDIVRQYWRKHANVTDFETWWREVVHDGIVDNTAAAPVSVSAGPIPPRDASAPTKFELAFRPDPYILDGSLANNAWLQELPRPMTKLTWDNALLVSPATAEFLNVESRDVVELDCAGATLSIPVWILPGQPDNSFTVSLGFGRTRAGTVGNGAGFNAYPLRTTRSLWRAAVTSIRRTGREYPLASTQVHYGMHDRSIVISTTLDRFQRHPEIVREEAHEPEFETTLYPHWPVQDYGWGMAIDLTACVNCNACVVACQAENNIPVVGKEQVLFNRQMHWLRIDTYFEGDWSNPAAHYQPVPCMHCEYAPCEFVCPTQATVHSRDGLNDMIYNRCVGTRYCSNNCPYKVRRFNFLEYADENETLKMMRNPDVTVRTRGVMEKCTYCVQRIRQAEIEARKENRRIRDGAIETACQDVCPTRAIVFGDITDPNTLVSQRKRSKLNYSLLAELNTRPRTTYLAELRNPNPEITGAS